MADFEDLVSDREELPFCQFDVDDDGSIPYGSLNPIAPFVCSPNAICDLAIEIAQISSSDFVVELGCGDGSFLLRAAQQTGCSGWGIDISQLQIERAISRTEAMNLSDLISFTCGDLFSTCEFKSGTDTAFTDNNWFEMASVIYIYLVPHMLKDKRLLHVLNFCLSRGCKILAYEYPLPIKELQTPERSVSSTYISGIHFYETHRTLSTQ